MYEELVKELRKESCGAKTTTWWRAADAIEELSATVAGFEATTDVEFVKEGGHERIRFVPKWIPVTERLPDKRKWVLCRCEANIIEVLRRENNEWYHDPMHVYYPSFVTHWMPLPTPPKEETE